MKKLGYKVEAAAELSDLCRATLYKAIRDGKLIARKHGRTTIILHEDLEAFLRGMPKKEAAAR